MNYRRLVHLARVLKEREPDFAADMRTRYGRLFLRLEPETFLLLRALGAEEGVSADTAASRIIEAALTSDRVLVRWVFLGEKPRSRAERDRVAEAAVAEVLADEEMLPPQQD